MAEQSFPIARLTRQHFQQLRQLVAQGAVCRVEYVERGEEIRESVKAIRDSGTVVTRPSPSTSEEVIRHHRNLCQLRARLIVTAVE